MTNSATGPVLLAAALLLIAPCCSLKKLAVNKVGDAIASGGSTYERDDDVELVGDALPFSLKLLESLLAESPDHLGMLNATCKGFTSYGYAYVQSGDKALADPDLAVADAIRARARRLYLRALRYGLHGLDVTYPGFSGRLTTDPKGAVAVTKAKDVERLYWCAAALGLAISVSKEDAAMIARVPEVEAMLDRALALDESWGEGTLHEFAITLAGARPGGGRADELDKHFERALALSHGTRAALFLTYAEAAAVPKQDARMFRDLIAKALAVDADAHEELRLSNLVAQRRALWLRAHVADFFLDPGADDAGTGGAR
jgi:predicted anti-sigma-YlaC factor YlaD